MAKVKHEAWIDKEGLTTLCFVHVRGDDCRQLMEEGSKIIHTIYAESHFEAMTLYYKYMKGGVPNRF